MHDGIFKGHKINFPAFHLPAGGTMNDGVANLYSVVALFQPSCCNDITSPVVNHQAQCPPVIREYPRKNGGQYWQLYAAGSDQGTVSWDDELSPGDYLDGKCIVRQEKDTK
jgi:hypothetical protein